MDRTPSGPRDNFIYLLLALVIFTIVGPVAAVKFGTIGRIFAELSFSLTMLIALWSLHSSRRIFVSGLVLISINIIATALWLLLELQSAAGNIAHLAGLAFLALTGFAAMRAIMEPGPVDLNKVVGAVCIYVLLGVGWAEAYQLLHNYNPDSFSGLDQHLGQALSWRFLYFSFVTLTTLGYGDALPLTIYAQTLTVMETVIGQIYLAVLVAALVSGYLSENSDSR